MRRSRLTPRVARRTVRGVMAGRWLALLGVATWAPHLLVCAAMGCDDGAGAAGPTERELLELEPPGPTGEQLEKTRSPRDRAPRAGAEAEAPAVPGPADTPTSVCVPGPAVVLGVTDHRLVTTIDEGRQALRIAVRPGDAVVAWAHEEGHLVLRRVGLDGAVTGDASTLEMPSAHRMAALLAVGDSLLVVTEGRCGERAVRMCAFARVLGPDFAPLGELDVEQLPELGQARYAEAPGGAVVFRTFTSHPAGMRRYAVSDTGITRTDVAGFDMPLELEVHVLAIEATQEHIQLLVQPNTGDPRPMWSTRPGRDVRLRGIATDLVHADVIFEPHAIALLLRSYEGPTRFARFDAAGAPLVPPTPVTGDSLPPAPFTSRVVASLSVAAGGAAPLLERASPAGEAFGDPIRLDPAPASGALGLRRVSPTSAGYLAAFAIGTRSRWHILASPVRCRRPAPPP